LVETILTRAFRFEKLKMKKQPSLPFCIIMDLIGYATYAIPFLGEIGDVIWAPVSAIIFYISFGGKKGAIGGVLNFIEELSPGLILFPRSPLCGHCKT
jgi:hypothetical protein